MLRQTVQMHAAQCGPQRRGRQAGRVLIAAVINCACTLIIMRLNSVLQAQSSTGAAASCCLGIAITQGQQPCSTCSG